MHNPYFVDKLKPIEVKAQKSISQLVSEMFQTGFQGRKLGETVEVWHDMAKEKGLTIIMGYAGSMSTTGQWKIVNWLIKNRFIDVLVSTGANVSEDIFEAMGFNYWKGSHQVDDEDLLRHQIDRYYDVYAGEQDYRGMEDMVREFYKELKDGYPYSSRELLALLGRKLSSKKIKSIAATAYEHGVPIFCPAIVDSGYGIAALLSRKFDDKRIVVDQMKDFEEFVSVGEKSRDTGVVYIGGGVPKDFTQLLTVGLDLVRGGKEVFPHSYAIQITTDSPQWGGLSGCTFEEAVSWGKISSRAKKVVCYCDATIALPLITHALAERVKKRTNPPDFSKIFAVEA